MTIIDSNEQDRIQANERACLGDEPFQKMPIYRCSCGKCILIVPDIAQMNKAIREHLLEHKSANGKHLTEETLTAEILAAICNSQF
jgi:hypothetical protein